ncbi:MAG: UDP-3-O-acylglucosamine N-acyltransferase [Deltaproteobacteria bacterium]|nr:UDP-3-O-acylglucosamine N-acyltransferase [Deltaproteobacteria bacterium]
MAISRTLSELANHVDGKVIGDGSVVIHKVSPIDQAGPGEISFLSNPRYQRFLPQCRASAVIVAPGVVRQSESSATLNFLETVDPYIAFAKILQLLSPAPQYSRAISAAAHVDISAVIAAGATIFPNVFIGARTRIGQDAVLFPGVFIGDDVEIGAASVLHPNVVVRHGCRVGERVILHAGVVIGSDGFGYAGAGSDRVKIPQVGVVVVNDDVEIGANTTVDRATLGQTVIGRGAKIDNLVQIAHNVVIGEHSVIASQAGIAGSTRLGKNVTLAGQVGVVNHIQIGDGATIGPQSGVGQSVPAGALLSSGLTAAPHHEWLKVMVLLPQLPKLWSAVRSLEKQLARMIAAGKKAYNGD